MQYVNTKTQAVIETACEVKGGNWVKVETGQPTGETATTVKKNTKKKRGE